MLDNLRKRVGNTIRKIKLVDKFLILAMILLFVEALASIFTVPESFDLLEKIDVVMRTTMASIFGYFISANFIKPETDTREADASDAPRAVSRPAQPVQPDPEAQRTHRSAQNRRLNASLLQISVVGSLFICALLALIFIKYFSYPNQYLLARLYEFRDIICGCTGFLIGMPTDRTPN